MLTNRQVEQIINASIEAVGKNDTTLFNSLCDKIENEANINQIIMFVNRVPNTDIKKFGLFVAEHGTAQQNFEFACIPNSDTRMHRDIILSSQDIEYNLRAGKQIDDEYREDYVNKHGAIVLNGSPYQNFKFVSGNKAQSLQIKLHLDKIIESKNAYINYLCAKEIPKADILAHGQAVIDSNDVSSNYAFARIDGCARSKHLELIANLGTPYDNMEVLKSFTNCKKSIHVINIFSSDDTDVKLECLKWLEQQNLLEKAKKINLVYDFIEQCQNGYIAQQNY